MRTVAETIKLLRLERHLSQEQFAKELNVSRSAIGMWESGERIPNEEMKELICDYFNVDMNYLYGKTNVRNSYREGVEGIDNQYDTPRFTNIDDAMIFLISNPVVSAYGGYDFDRMSDKEKIRFANKVAGIFKIISEEYKKK